MNNFIRLKEMPLFSLVLCFLLLNSVEMTGQSLKLTKDLDDGDIIYTYTPCVLDFTSSTLDFSILNNLTESATILMFSVSSNPENTYYMTNLPSLYPIPASTNSPTFTAFFENAWGDLPNNNGLITFTFDLIFSTNGASSNLLKEPSNIGVRFIATYDLCPEITELPYSEPEHIKHTKRNRISKENNQEITISPNPTQDIFQIKYSLEKDANVDIALYNNLGKKVKTIVNSETQSAGQYTVEESLPSNLPNGIYYVISNIGGEISSEKLVKL